MKIFLSTKARQDLSEVYFYSSVNFGEPQAQSYTQSFEKAFDIISSHPKIGNLYNLVDDITYMYQHRMHMIFYLIEDTHIQIDRIFHSKRDIRSLFED
jgi:toxin ParE1/3/4